MQLDSNESSYKLLEDAGAHPQKTEDNHYHVDGDSGMDLKQVTDLEAIPEVVELGGHPHPHPHPHPHHHHSSKEITTIIAFGLAYILHILSRRLVTLA